MSQVGDSVELRARALRLVVPEDCVICDRHAGWLHGAEMVLAPNEHLELRPVSVFRPSGMGRLRNGLADSGERNLTPGDVVELQGLRVTTPLRTAWDLGRQRSRDTALSGLDAMLRLAKFEKAELVYGVQRFGRMRWVTVLRELSPIADGRAESPGESVLRLRWIDLALPTPRPQVPVVLPGGRMVYLDVGSEAARLAAEFHGWAWHSSPQQVVHDDERLGFGGGRRLGHQDGVADESVGAAGRRRPHPAARAHRGPAAVRCPGPAPAPSLSWRFVTCRHADSRRI